MKREKLFTFLWGCLLSFAVSFSAVCCVVTAFRMEVPIGTVAAWCGVTAVVSSACYCLPLGIVPLASYALILGILWQKGRLLLSIQALLYRLSRQYDRAYGWGIIEMSALPISQREEHLWLVLCMLGMAIAIAISWSVCRKKTTLPGMIPAALLLGSCLVVTDTVPKVGYLYLLFFSILLLIMTGAVRKQDEKRGNRLCAVLTVPIAVVLLVLFAVVPQNEYDGTEPSRKAVDQLMESEALNRLMGGVHEATVTGTSVDSGVVNLRTVGVRVNSRAEIMQVLTDYDDKIYLRGRALDRYDGTTWTASGVSTQKLYWPDPKRLEEGGEVLITTRYAHRYLYLPYYVQSRDLSEVTRGLENQNKLTQYSFSCDKLSEGNDFYQIYTQSYYDSSVWEMEFAHYLHLADDVWEWAEPLALEITKDEETIYGKAMAIGDYVRNSATYDTNTHRMPASEKDFAKWFLEDSETGYCVHFATSATVLLQAAGIPARYVTGYTADARAAYINVIRAEDAHAWTEYWLPGYGWMILEATPPDLREQPTEPTEEKTPATIPTTPEEREDVVLGTPQPLPTGPVLKLEYKVVLWVVVSVLGAVGILYGQRLLRLRLKKKRREKGSTNQQALNRWNELTGILRWAGKLPAPEVYDLAEKAKFSRHIITEEELTRMDEALKGAVETLRGHNFLRKFWYRFILVLY